MSDQQNPQYSEKPVSGTVDALRLEHHIQQIRDNQNLMMGVIGGLIAALAGAFVWGLVSHYTGYQIGWMAIGVGFLVGYAVKTFGKGLDVSFGIAGALLSLFGCLMGNLLAVCFYISEGYGIGVMEVISTLDINMVVEIMTDTFSPMDVLFYGIAIYQGYKVSRVVMSQEELAEFQNK